MYNYEWILFDKNGEKLPVVKTSENRIYAAGDVKIHNGKSYEIVHRIIVRVNKDSDLQIAVEV